MVTTFPPAFSRPRWTLTEETNMHTVAAASLSDFIDASKLTGGPVAWNLNGFTQHAPILVRTAAPHVMASSLELVGTIDEIAHIFKRIQPFQPFDAKESATICFLDTKSANHNVALQWMRLKTPRFITKDRDACILDSRNVFRRDGKRGYACLFESIEIAECPMLDISHGYVRAKIEQTGYVFTEIHPGLVNVVHSLYVDFKGFFPAFLSQRYMKKQVASIKSLETYIRQVRMQDAALLYPVQPQKQCTSCRKVFGFFELTACCSSCGENVCQECISTGLVQGKKVVPLCIPCILMSSPKPSTSSSIGILRAQIQRNVSKVEFPDDETEQKNMERGLIQSLAATIAQRSNLSILRSLEETDAHSDGVPSDDPAYDTPPRIHRGRGRSVNGSGVWEDAIWKFHTNLERFKHQKTLRTV
ncbi:Aste57867_18617 [Aphanomyces stellatus]|uniref:Aste57867_18617 protein n=1 Tax=Aphanomyces stellatus TaxID=120398 RepID=A0A485LB74_9STRA|nr:hypothetical protein As57867_018555 [Aphanomyces stellatus]VFT95352.1 Aste57867_18617 [Aphanomyces stellatus]